MPVNKIVEATSDPNKFILTLDAYATASELDGVALDKNLVLKEVLSDYVQLDADATVKYEVFTQDYLGKDDLGKDKWGVLNPFDTAKVELSSSDGTSRMDTIEVTGFDYGANYVMEAYHTDPHNSSNTTFRGRKLVVKVYIETRDGFWGGNNVPTNKSTTAIYSNGTVFKPFPMPEINVPIDVVVKAEDKTIYYDGNIDGDGDGNEGDELITKVTIGGKEVTVNNDGTFTPEDDWMDDFANASWDEDSTKPDSDLNNQNPDDYTYTVVVTPTTDGTTNQSENPSNIAGNVDGGEVEDTHSSATPAEDSDTGHVYVLIPEVTFKDSTTDFGTPAEGYDYEDKDYVSTEWVFMEDTADTANAPEPSGQEPELTLTYTPDTEGADALVDGDFVTDTKVNVTVTMGEGEDAQDITDIVTFDWQDDCSHDESMDIEEHKGDVDSNEFWVHVNLAINPDTVVIDYGPDVVINVLSNDPKTDTVVPVLSGIAKQSATKFTTSSVSGTYGKLSISGSNVRFKLNTGNGMQFSKEEVFKYQATYTINGKDVKRDSTVTVIPATTIYYEDGFVTFSTWDNATKTKHTESKWAKVGTTQSATQAQDRPGDDVNNALGSLDADNLYGYDAAYAGNTNKETYSLGSAMTVTVNKDQYAEAEFTFSGTGFDIISLTNSKSGTIMVDVYSGTNRVRSRMLDTYYGYVYKDVDGDGKKDWVVDPDASDTLYQVPVIKMSGLDYGTYRVVITVAYNKGLDHQPEADGKKTSYDFWLDAIRIYDPANDGANSGTIKDAYVADGEGWPEYFELRNLLISVADFKSNVAGTNGIIFIDNTAATNKTPEYTISDYRNYGPNNELYLAPGQSVAFNLNVPGDVAGIHLAVKSVGLVYKEDDDTDDRGYVKVYDAEKPDVNVLTGKSTNMRVDTATDMYYDITALNGKTVVIQNGGNATRFIISITNIKVTYNSEHTDSIEQSYFTANQNTLKLALRSLQPKVELAITRQPVDYVGLVGDNATFNVIAQGEDLTYQWYYRDGESTWSKAANGTEPALNVEFLAYRNNRQYRCEITDAEGNTVTTDTVKLTAQAMDLVITGQPVSAFGAVDQELAFTVEATGNGLVYQWYYSDDNGASWLKSGTPGFNTPTLLPILRSYRDGYQYKCVITDVFGNSVTSDAVTMSVKSGEVVITEQPAAVTGALNQLYTFKAGATGENLTYRWEYSDNGGETWQLSWNEGYETDTLTVRLYSYRDGYLYRCVVTSGLKSSVCTDAAELKLQAPSAVIVEQPTNSSVMTGETARFQVKAEGTDLTYQWYRSNDNGTTWEKTWLDGCNTDTLCFTANSARAAAYMCQVTDGSGNSVWTNVVKLQILSAKLQILNQPESITCAAGETATFTVKAQGDSVKYQWYVSADNGATWSRTYLGGSTTDTLSFTVNTARAAKVYKCVITDASGNTVTSEVVAILVNA
jgi:hypothetical protein